MDGGEISAGTVAYSIIAKTDQLTQGMNQAKQVVGTTTASIKRDTDAASAAIEASHGKIRESSTSAGSSQLILQSIIRRTSDQMAAGAPVATIFAEHISGLVEAAELAGGSFGKFGAVLAGPWGLALSAGVSIAALLAQHLFEAADATDKHKKSTKELADAIDQLNKLTEQSNRTHEQEVGVQLAAARAEAAHAATIRDTTRAKLEGALADEKAKAAQSQAPGQRGDLGAIGAGNAANRVQELTAALAAADKTAASTSDRLDKAFKGAVADQVITRVANATDKAAAAQARYNKTVTESRQAFARGDIDQGAFVAKVEAAQKALDAASKRRGRGDSGAGDADAQARLEAATNGVQKAEAQLSITRRDAAKELKAGTITQAEYEARIKSGIEAVNGAREAAKAHTAALHEQAAEARDLTTSLAALQSRYDPVAAAGNAYLDALKDITNLRAAGKIDDDTAALYRQQAAFENIADTQGALAKQHQEAYDSIFGKGYNQAPDKLSTAGSERSIDKSFEEGPFGEKATKQQEKNVESLASLFESAFNGGTGGIWKKFKEEGEKELAYLLAKFAILQIGQGGSVFGNLSAAASSVPAGASGGLGVLGSLLGGGGKSGGGFFGSLLGAVGSLFGLGGGKRAPFSGLDVGGGGNLPGSLVGGPVSLVTDLGGLIGFANGGSGTFGGKPGVDQNVVSVNGTPQFKVSAGEPFSIGGTGNMRVASPTAAAGDTHYHINVNAENSVTPADFGKALAGQILKQADLMDRTHKADTLNRVSGVVRNNARSGNVHTYSSRDVK